MPADIRRLIVALVIVGALAVPLYHAVAYDIDDIVEVNINEDTARRICQSQSVLDGIRAIQNGYLRQLVRDTINELRDTFTTYAFQWLLCNIIPDKTVGLFGSSVTFKSPDCPLSLGGADVAVFKRQALDRIKNDFTARCIASGAQKKAQLDVRQIILENGPDGGAAYVTNWIEDIYVGEDQRAIRRFCAVLANTSICPYMKEYVANSFPECPRSYFESPPDLTGLGGRVDGGQSFVQQAQCTLPEGVTPEALSYDFVGFGGFDALGLLLEPQNNPNSFIDMAQAELTAQRATAVRAAEAEAIAGGGFRSLYGDAASSCMNRDANGFCLALGPVRQPSGAVRDGNAAAIQSSFDWINNADEMNTMLGDVRRRLASMLLTIDEVPLDYDIEFDASTQDYEDIGNGVRPPEDIRLPVDENSNGPSGPGGPGEPGGPNDPLCTGGNPLCFCVRNDPNFTFIREAVREATEAAIIQHNNDTPPMLEPPGCVSNECSVVPGQEANFLIAVCETTVGESLQCRPNGADEVVVTAPNFDVSVDIITAGGQVRIPGQTVAACQPGVH